MLSLTFGEQVKIVLSRKGMTIKELAQQIEEKTGKKMSRQNLTQRLGRDNFQEQDMRLIADILGCSFQLSILASAEAAERASVIEEVPPTKKELDKLAAKKEQKAAKAQVKESLERDITVGEFVDMINMQEPVASEPEISEEIQEQTAAESVISSEEHELQSEEKQQEEEAAGTEAADADTEYQEPQMTETAEEVAVDSAADQMQEEERVTETAEPEYAEVQAEEAGQAEMSESIVAEGEEDADEALSVQEEVSEEPAADDIQVQTEEKPVEKKESQFSKLTKIITPHRREEAKKAEKPRDFQPIKKRDDTDEDLVNGDVNPYTGHEYQTNSVRTHPKRIGYVQVYDRKEHKWTDMTEWAFLGYEERKKVMQGKDYKPPIYLD